MAEAADKSGTRKRVGIRLYSEILGAQKTLDSRLYLWIRASLANLHPFLTQWFDAVVRG